jgi:ABC-type glycerol-3-phosphate transport system substrate-binding protein
VITFGARETQRAAFEPLISRFNDENPDVRVQFVSTDPVLAQLKENLATPLDKIARDLASAADTYIANGYSEDAERDLRPLIDADGAFNLADFWPGALPAAGPVRRLPGATSVTVFMYNKDLFRTRNVAEPQGDWTWADLKRAIEQLAQQDGDTVRTYGMVAPLLSFEFALRGELAAAGVSMTTDRAPLEALDLLLPDHPAAPQVIENVVQLIRSGALFYDPADIQQDTMRELIQGGKLGIWPRDMQFMLPDELYSFETGVVAFPAIPYPMVQFNLPEREYIISSGSQHPEAAWRWLSFLSRQLPPYPSSGFSDSLPVRRSVFEQNQVLTQFSPEVAAAVQTALNQPVPDTFLPAGWTWSAIQDVLETDTTPQVAAQTAYERSKQSWTEALRQPPPTPGPPIVVAPPVSQVPSSANASTIRFRPGDLNGEAVRRAATLFSQANPTIIVELAGSTAQNAPLADLAAAHDCFAFAGVPRAADATQVLDLRPLLDADPRFVGDDFADGLLALFTRDGRLLGLPHTFDGPVLVYQSELVQRVAAPRNDWTFVDVQQAAVQLTQPGATPQYGFAIRDSVPSGVQTLIEGFGVAPLAPDGTPRLADPQLQDAARQVLELLRNASPHTPLPQYARTSPPNRADSLIQTGAVAMWLDTVASVQRGPNSLDNGQALSVIALPRGDANAPRQVRARGLYISAQTQHAAACWQWLTYLSDYVEALPPGIPARRALAQSDAFLSAAPPWLPDVSEAYINSLTSGGGSHDLNAAWTRNEFVALYWFDRALDRALQGGDLGRELQAAEELVKTYRACMESNGQLGLCARQTDPQYDGFAQ